MTGVPMVLNTSFNENEPIVCFPEEALDCFLRTKMDVLALGNFWIERQSEPITPPPESATGTATATAVAAPVVNEDEEAQFPS
jgi:hypothetical protein